MLETLNYALLATNAYATSPAVVNPDNVIPLPAGWSELSGYKRDIAGTGFLANVYKNGSGDIVIAYSGTTDNSLDWLMGNVPAATGFTLAPQVTDAARLYLDVLKVNPSANITFTGHSLGGGLASLMAVFFDRQATTFDEAPFEKSADSGRVVDALKKELTLSGYTLPPEFASYAALDYLAGTFIPSPTRVARESNVSHIYLKDEVLSLLQTPQGKIAATALGLSIGSGTTALITTGIGNIAGNEQIVDAKAINGNGWGWPLLNGHPVDLHYMPLLAAFLQSSDLLAASRNTPEILQKIFTSKLTTANTQDRDQRNFLNLMVQQEAQGNGSWAAFASDINKLTGELGSGPLKAALVSLDIGLHYGQGMDHVNGVSAGAFESAFKSVTGGIQFAPKADHGEWLFDSLAEFRRKLPTLYADIGAAGGKFTESAERYTLPTTGVMSVTAAADGKADFMLGGGNADTLAGSDGGDVLIGRGGADTLDGGSGWDTLIGGKDDDNLNGGSGYDRYLYQLGDGSDLVEDVDGGSIQVFGNDDEYVFGGVFIKQQGSDTWIGETSSHTITIQRAGDWMVSSDDGAIVRFSAATDLGSFAMKLVDDQLAAPLTTRTISGDYQPLDFNLTKDGIQTQTDDLGNLILDATQPAPGRADSFFDGAGNDLIQGLGGNDNIGSSRGGDDRIEGNDGDDWMVGGLGNDLVIGGTGRDVLVEGGGNDRLYADTQLDIEDALAAENAIPSGLQGEALSGGAGDDLAIGGIGNDVLFGGLGDDILIAGSGDDNINGDAMADNILPDWSVTRTVSDNSYNTQYNQFNMNRPTDGGADVIHAGAGADWVSAGNGNDYVDGGNDADVLFGEGGNDNLFGGSGNDHINGDSGSLPLSAHGDDYLDGEEGDDVLFGQGGNDQVFGGIGADQVYGNEGNDYLDGEEDADLLGGGAGNDELFGGAGNDVLYGDSGNGIGDGNDYLDGEAGDDLLLGLGGSDELHGGDGNDRIAGDNGGSDTSGAADTIYGGAGNDTIDGQGGDDTIDAGADNDLVAGGLGDDQISGGSGADQLQGGEGNDSLDGGSENDTLFGQAGNDTLLGGSGNDYLIGGLGDDLLDGGEGDDVYFYSRGEGRDRIVDSGGTDWLVFNDITWGQIVLGTGSLKLTLPDSAELHLDDFDPDNPHAAGGIEYFQFADGAVMSKSQLIDALGIQPTGTPEADVLSGTALSETINALAGDDIVTARAGNDTVLAGDGADVVYGGDGNDAVFGGNGDDVLLGEAGNDTLYGEAGNDLLAGGTGSDQLLGGDGDDQYLFQSGDGQDTAIDTLGVNSIALGAGLTLDAVVFSRQNSDLLVSVKNSNDRLTVRDWFAADSHFASVTLGDGTLLDHAGVEAAMPKNQAPLAAPDSGTVVEDAITEIAGNALANDSDPEGRALRVTNPGIQAGAVGSLSLSSAGGWSYVLANGTAAVQSLGAGQSLTENFAYTVSDDDPNGAATAESSIRITVQGTNDLPVLGADSAATAEDAAPIAGNVLANDRDIDAGSVLTIANPGTRSGVYGALSLGVDGTYSYSLTNASTAVQSLAAGQTVTDNFAFNVGDGIAQVGGSLAIGIAGRNDAPIVATALADQSTAVNTSWTWALPAGSFADVDAGDILGYGATLADGSVLPSWLTFSPTTQTFTGRVPKSASGSLDIRVTASDRSSASAADVFTLSFAAGDGGGGGGGGNGGGGGGSQGNEGVGNGVDAAPPGHDISFNDGPGTGPGDPGAQGGKGGGNGGGNGSGNGYRPPRREDIVMTELRIDGAVLDASAPAMVSRGNSAEAHAAAPGQVKQAAEVGTTHAAPANASATDAAVSPAPTFALASSDVARSAPDTGADTGTDTASPVLPDLVELLAQAGARTAEQSGTTAPSASDAEVFARWLAVQAALDDQKRQQAKGAWFAADTGADVAALHANAGLLGALRTQGADPLAQLAGQAEQLKVFQGLGKGVSTRV